MGSYFKESNSFLGVHHENTFEEIFHGRCAVFHNFAFTLANELGIAKTFRLFD